MAAHACLLLKRFNLTPSLACLLRKNVADYAAGYRAKIIVSAEPTQALNKPLAMENPPQDLQWEDSYIIDLMLSGFCRSKHDPNVGTVTSLVYQIKHLKKQVKERKEWAYDKAIQAARKLNSAFIELRTLRTQQAESQKLDMEDALRKATSQANLADAAVKLLGEENEEIRAETEALKLKTAESDKLFLEATERETKLLKKIETSQKQNNKLQEENAEENYKILWLQQQLACLRKAHEDIKKVQIL